MDLPIQPTEIKRPEGWTKCWIPENQPEFVDFFDALNEFSQSRSSMSWARAMCRPPSMQPWSESQEKLFAAAIKRAPKALAVAPYGTVVRLFQMRNLAADQNKETESFWKSLEDACFDLADEQHY